jgi:hypothetical protein
MASLKRSVMHRSSVFLFLEISLVEPKRDHRHDEFQSFNAYFLPVPAMQRQYGMSTNVILLYAIAAYFP